MANTVGETLRSTREERGLSLDQASSVTRVGITYLQALEANDPYLLPSVVQARGYLRLYAGYLGLPVQPLLDAWPDRAPVFEIEQPPIEVALPDSALDKQEAPIVGEHAETAATPISAQPKELEHELPSPVESEAVSQPEGEITASRAIFIAIGQDLRKRRETISLSIEDVERFTRLRARYITALEQGNVEDLPSLVQGRGMLANYAEFLDLDADQYLTRFADALQARRLEMLVPEKTGRKQGAAPRGAKLSEPKAHLPGWRRFLTPDLMIGGSLFVLFVMLVVWGATRVNDLNSTDLIPTPPSISEVLLNTSVSGDQTPQATPTESTATQAAPVNEPISTTDTPPAGSQTVTVVVVSNAPLQLNIVASLRAWMQVTVDGSVAFQGRTIPGNAYPFTGRDRIELVTGDGAALQAVFNQQDLGDLGTSGEVVRLIFSKDGILTPTSQYTATPSQTPRPTLTVQPSPLPATPTITPLIP